MRKFLIAVLCVSFLALSSIAFALPLDITLQETSVSGQAVSANFAGFYNGGVLAGYYNLTISGSAVAQYNRNYAGFCVDPAWAPTGASRDYALNTLASFSADSRYNQYRGAAWLLENGQASDRVALQLAVWEIMLDGYGGSLSSGKFSINSGYSNLSKVNDLISQAHANYTSVNANNFLLAYSPRIGEHFGVDHQDYLIRNPAPVPEPATMLLLGSGLVGIAAFRRKALKK